MNRTEVRDALFPNCPIRNVLTRIGDKWSLLVLFTMERNGNQRFKELQRNIPDISQKMLTATLKTLEADGLVLRKAYPEVPPRVEYTLTDKGKSLLPHIDSLIGWALDNMNDIMESIEKNNMEYMFNNCTNLLELKLLNFDISKTTNMNYLFV